MGSEIFNATGSDGRRYKVYRIGSTISTSNLDRRGSVDGLARWQLANGDALNPTKDPKVFSHFADPERLFTLD